MSESLSAKTLMTHVRALADDIGPRPAGHPAEAQARAYIRRALAEVGISEVETLPFAVPDTWGYALLAPALAALGGNLLGATGRLGRLGGALTSLLGAYALWRAEGGHRQPFFFLYPTRESATLIGRIPPSDEPRRKLVLIGHTDSNKHRLMFAPITKRFLLGITTSATALAILNGLAQLAVAVGLGKAANRITRASRWGLIASALLALVDEGGGFIDGANDNASAVACLLGLGAHLKQRPLKHTEIWLAFTGAEEVGCLGMHALLDRYGSELTDAWFLDLEMVGAGEIAYVTRHSGLSFFNTYDPDAESLAWAERTAQNHPELGVSGRAMVISEEVGSLRGRGYRGLCLVGVGDGGWLANWHQYRDNTDNIEPASLERAARFAWAMVQTLDEA